MTTRRTLIAAAGASVLGSMASGAVGPAVAAAAGPGEASTWHWVGNMSANGWTINSRAIVVCRIAGSAATLAVRDGAAGIVLLHVARRWHYEIAPLDTMEGGGVTGHTANRTVGADFESNRLSGTAIALHPTAYPLRGWEILWPHHELVLRDILTDCAGTVVWGGDLTPAKQSHFHIAARPGSRALFRVAERLRTDIHTATRPIPGAPADPAAPNRTAARD